MSTYKTKFLKITENFIDELLRILPNDKNINLFKEKYYLIKKVNSTIIINSFIKYNYLFKIVLCSIFYFYYSIHLLHCER